MAWRDLAPLPKFQIWRSRRSRFASEISGQTPVIEPSVVAAIVAAEPPPPEERKSVVARLENKVARWGGISGARLKAPSNYQLSATTFVPHYAALADDAGAFGRFTQAFNASGSDAVGQLYDVPFATSTQVLCVSARIRTSQLPPTDVVVRELAGIVYTQNGGAIVAELDLAQGTAFASEDTLSIRAG